jgi:hypothetical protein
MVGAAVGQPVDEPGMAVEVDDDRLVDGEQAVEVPVRESVGMLACRGEPVQVHHVDEADLELRKVLAQQHGRRQLLLRGDVAARDRKSNCTCASIAGPGRRNKSGTLGREPLRRAFGLGAAPGQ